ncbi:Alkaline phosphatase D [Ceratocystis lukuohia]|uniref:Alkaline phosphatase D n=1 Tax=Ceratocystis lukuohia TaxID=2019550 RepID=A0ABR4M8X0_9PEZI
MTSQSKIAAVTSTALRLGSYIYFRWVPGPAAFPPTLLTLFAVYAPAAVSSYLGDSEYDLIDNELDVAVVQATLGPEDAKDGSTDHGEQSGEEAVQVVEVAETVSVRRRPSRPLTTLLTGVPRKSSRFMSLLTLIINLMLILGVIDFTFTAHHFWPSHDISFVRVGYVSPTEARFLIREPDQSKMPVAVEIRIKDAQAPFDTNQWQVAGGARWTTNETDFTAALTIALPHSQQHVYQWRTSNNHTGEFMSPPQAGALSHYNDGKFTFLSTSCIIPRFPYNPLNHPLSIPGLNSLARVLPTLQAHFMLFLGDFIYIDVPLAFGKTREDYRRKYRQVYASPEWASVGQNLSWIHTLDDHEISNNWSDNTTGVYTDAMSTFESYHAAANPPTARMAGSSASRPSATYFEFTQGPISVFMLDTRTYRTGNLALNATDPKKTMLGKDQLADLLYWLNRPEPRGVTWKVIASSVPFTKNFPVDGVDTWGGFLAERRVVLEAIWDSYLHGIGVIILSGDRHEFAVTRFPPPAGGKWPQDAAPYEFSVSPLNQFSSPIPTYRQTDDEDEVVHYLHLGLSKFGAITVENFGSDGQSSLLYQMYLDGELAWNTTLISPKSTPETEKKITLSGASSIWSRIFT